MMFVKDDPQRISIKIAGLMNKRPVLSNYFFPDLKGVKILQTDKSIILKEKENDFFRLYCITTDVRNLKNILTYLDGTIVINVPTKNTLGLWSNLLSETGFENIGIYERYYNANSYVVSKFDGKFADISHFTSLKKLIFSNFNKYCDRLPNDRLLQKMIENKQVLINEISKKLTGLFIYTFIGKKCYFNLWYDKSGGGLALLFNVYALMNINNITYSYGWINSNNSYVKQIHEHFGWRADGLKDYTFCKHKNKSA